MLNKDKIQILNEIHENLKKLIELKTKEYEKQTWTGFYAVSVIIFVINLFRYDWNIIEALLISVGVIIAIAIIFWWLYAPLCFYVTKKIYGYDPDDKVKEIKEWINKKHSHTENDDIYKLNTINNQILNEINAIHENNQNLLRKEQETKKENIRTVIKYTFGVALAMVILVLVAISIDNNKQRHSANTPPQATNELTHEEKLESPVGKQYYEKVNTLKNRINDNQIQLMQSSIITKPNTSPNKEIAKILEANQIWWGDTVNSEEKTFIHIYNNTNSQIMALELETYSSYCNVKENRNKLVIAPEFIIQPNTEVIITYVTPKNIIKNHCINIIGVWNSNLVEQQKMLSTQKIRQQNQPKEVYAPPQNNSVSPEYLAAEQAHFNKILAAHPDAESIVQSQIFKNWVNNQSASNQSYYNNVLNNGSAAQVINIFSQYKKDLRSSQNNQKPITPPPQPKAMSSQDIYEQYQKPLIPSSDKPLEVQSAENMPDLSN